MNRPYLTPELDERYRLVASRDVWGKPIYGGHYKVYSISFQQHQSGRTGHPETTINMIVPDIPDLASIGYEQLMNRLSSPPDRFLQHLFHDINNIEGEIVGLFMWLKSLSKSHHELLRYNHAYVEAWYTKPELISVNLIWMRRENPDWTIIDGVLLRLHSIAELAILHHTKN